MGELGLAHRSPDPCRSVGKEPVCNARDLGLIPGSERSPGEENGNPLQYSCLENPMDRGAWQATVCGVVRVRHDLVIKPPLQTLRSFKWNKGSFFSAQAPWESRDLVLQRCLEMLMLMVEHVTLSDTGSENQGGRGRETPFSVSLRIYSIFWTPCHQRILIFPVWGGEMCRRDLNIQSLDSTLNS